MSNYQRLHPLVILKKSISWAFSFVLILIFDTLRNTSNKSDWVFSITIFGGLIVLAVIFNTYHWFTFKYAINPTTLSIKSGIFFKHEQTIPFSRIQSVHQESWLLFRPFRVVKLTIETASSSSKVESTILEVVSQSTYALLEKLRLGKNVPADIELKPINKQHYKSQYSVSMNDIIVFSLVDFNIISGILGLTAVFYHFSDFADKYLNPFLNKIVASGLLLLISFVIIIVILAILGSITKNIFKYYKFNAQRELNHIIIERGFFTRTTLSIPIERIQAIRIKGSLLQILLHIKTVELLLASGKESEDKENAEDTTFFLFPIINSRLLSEKLAQILPEFTETIAPKTSQSFPCLPHYFLFSRFQFLGLLLLVPLFFWNNNWSFLLGIAILLFTLLFVINSLWKTKSQSSTYYEKQLLIIRTVHFFTLTEYLCPLNKIQSISISTTPFLYQQQLGHTTFSLKTGETALEIKLKYLSWSICKDIKEACSPKIRKYTFKKTKKYIP
ncbi:PH domain-containing protein [Lactobacillus sp. UCMA15818]|uniref:PH domain-containing protein n=1 Tax=Lactobacillus sp. UCMA15818 TaxID=2583394 RepID=UPI0025B1CF2F|nr:PH domain-containing protein [Lactobacillus sp. UCMA15818]MDN2454021.1 PH domain-containing protein [Lactobacillus sp. UCMA15818]